MNYSSRRNRLPEVMAWALGSTIVHASRQRSLAVVNHDSLLARPAQLLDIVTGIVAFHAFVAFVLYKLPIIIASGAHPALLFCVSFALTAVLATLLGRFLAEQGTIRRLLFPRTTAELAGALRWPALGGQGAVAASKPEPRHHDR